MHIQTLLFHICLWLCNQYGYLKHWVFSWIGHIPIIYAINHLENGSWCSTNITFNYYTGYNLHKYQTGKYHVVIYTADRTQHMAFTGNLNIIPAIKLPSLFEQPECRKKIVLLDNEKPVDIDLQILDNYYANVQQFGDSAITNLADITSILGIKCTHISIIESRFAKLTSRLIGDTDLKYIYH